MMTRAALTAIGFLVGLGVGLNASRPAMPRLVSVPSLQDFVVSDSKTNRIYINLAAMAKAPPPLANFFFLHEEGHIALEHRPIGNARMRQTAELAADCWAAKHASAVERNWAIRFFRALGSVSFDADHPSGITRAAKIIECSP
jgi:hypothetical protein